MPSSVGFFGLKMSSPTSPPIEPEIEYPDTDGEPIAENTLQFRWIATIEGNLEALYENDSQVFVAGDLLWYPVKGEPKIRLAPDTLVAFGRPKGDRGSYRQWDEGGVAPQVVWEVLSPGNRPAEIEFKYDFYERYGVEEYYVYDPESDTTEGWIRRDGRFRPIMEIHGWVSPLLGIRFDTSENELALYHPDGQRFLTYVELMRRHKYERQKRNEAQQQAELAQQQAELAQQQAALAQQRAEHEHRAREAAEKVVEQERREKEESRAKAEQLAARLRALGIDPNG